MKYNCIIPVAGKDSLFVRNNLSLLFSYLVPESIYIITKASYFIYYKGIDSKIRSKIILINEDNILHDINLETIKLYLQNAGFNPKNAGWYFQQFIKMGFAKSSFANENDYYLTWDSDTVPLKEMSFFSKENQPFFTMKEEYHIPYFTTIKTLLGIDKNCDQSFICENMMMNKVIMKELILKIDESNVVGSNWCEKIINALPKNTNNSFSEFETYGTFVNHYYPDSYLYRELFTFRDAGKFYTRYNFKKHIDKLSNEYEIVSLEHRHNPNNFMNNILSSTNKGIIHLINILLNKSNNINIILQKIYSQLKFII